jgi:hypothetical protein
MSFLKQLDLLLEFLDGFIGRNVGQIIVLDLFDQFFIRLFQCGQMVGQVVNMVFRVFQLSF